MTYLEKADELNEEIRHGINHSSTIPLSVVEEWNELIEDVMYSGKKNWDDEYKRVILNGGFIMKWYETDELQWCRKREDTERTYDFVQVVWLDTVRGDEGYPDKEYTVVTGSVCLNDYTDEDIVTEICGYYDSIEQMCESYDIPFECWNELDSVIAECIFEAWENFDSHGMFTKEEAINFAKEQMTAE